MSERKTTDHLDIYEGENYTLITTALSAGLELVDVVINILRKALLSPQVVAVAIFCALGKA